METIDILDLKDRKNYKDVSIFLYQHTHNVMVYLAN